MTKIEWTHRPGTTGETWNPVTGCTKISEGCAHCYAERMSKRLKGRFGYPEDDPFRVTVHPDKLELPLRWKKPRTVFVCSMGDLFHKDVPTQTIALVWRMMNKASRHTFLVLTKRPKRMAYFLKQYDIQPLPSVWLGVTTENQQRANERIPLLLQCPAAVRFVSVEPMLGPVDIRGALGFSFSDAHEGFLYDVPAVDWIIVGGETGAGARPMDPGWARSVRDQCKAAGIPFFIKKVFPKKPVPADLFIREYPDV